MNRHAAQLLKANATKQVSQAQMHAFYRLLKREWVSTPHKEKGRLRKRLERGLAVFLNPDSPVPAVRAFHRARDARAAARRKRARRKAVSNGS